ncbi:Uncharacterised protein [Mycoplasmopsis citelli]|uniref:Fido domain-containing protein n=1 Tax=Mycoplasmopsis citelli TaxID=171281 RepID=A0A449B0Y3_9BACT|nr:hypothetical protein [Mycoplasmopsis citelli]VEU74257.1 Uncharacterised protein [Mycoplasmopsis citelli]
MNIRWKNLVICLDEKALKKQKSFYLNGQFETRKIKLYDASNFKTLYFVLNEKAIIQMSFAYIETEIIKTLIKKVVEKSFKFAEKLSTEEIDERRIEEFNAKINLLFENYIKYKEEPENQNTIDLLVHIVSRLVGQHILLNGNKRAIFSFMVIFLRYFCGLYLKWSDEKYLYSYGYEIQKFNWNQYTKTFEDWVINAKEKDIEEKIKKFILENSIISINEEV